MYLASSRYAESRNTFLHTLPSASYLSSKSKFCLAKQLRALLGFSLPLKSSIALITSSCSAEI